MTESEAAALVRRIYWFALGFGVIGTATYFGLQGWRPATAFALGSATSVGNLWLFERITHSIEPAPAGEPNKKPPQAGLFVLRYIVLLAVGYAIVKALGVNALAVILGLLTSTAAVLTSTALELVQSLFMSRSTH
jgi:hypothetical protein